MNVLIKLFLSFFKIGCFAFGGGWSIVGLIQQEMVGKGYLGFEEFSRAVAISQITPGPIAINIATYTGFKYYGIIGAIVATSSLLLPTIIILCLLGLFIKTFVKNKSKLLEILIPGTLYLFLFSLIRLVQPRVSDISMYLIAIPVFFITGFTKLNPIITLLISGLASVIVAFFFNFKY